MTSADDFLNSDAPTSADAFLDAPAPLSDAVTPAGNPVIAANPVAAGAVNALADTALGASQAIGSLLPKHLTVGGLDIGSEAGTGGINDIENIKNTEVSDSLQGNPLGQALFKTGNIVGNTGMFLALDGENPGYIRSLLTGSGLATAQPADNSKDRLENAAVGGASAVAGKGFGDLFSTAVSDPTKQAALQTAQDFNIPVFRSQVSDNPLTRAVASFSKEIPGSGAGGRVADQVKAFNSAVLGTIGQTGDAVTPEALAAADNQIGNVYKTMTARYDLPANQQFKTALDALEQDGSSNLVGDKLAAFQQQLNNVRGKVVNATSGQNSSNTGIIDGQTYQNLRSNIGRAMRGTNGSPEMGQLQNLIDQQFQSVMSPQDAATFTAARGQYRNLLTLEKVVANSPNEPISPSKLQGAVKNVFGDYAYGGGSDLERLSRLGNLLKDTYPNSGTATRNQLWEAAKHVGGPMLAIGAGGEVGREESGGSPLGVLGGALGAVALSRYGMTPYLFSRMGSNPALLQSALPSLGYGVGSQFGSFSPPVQK